MFENLQIHIFKYIEFPNGVIIKEIDLNLSDDVCVFLKKLDDFERQSKKTILICK